MKSFFLIIGNRSMDILPILKHVFLDDLVDFIALNYNADFIRIQGQPDLVVFMDFEYRDMDYYALLRDKYKKSKVLLNTDNEFLSEELALVDGRKKESYSVGCPWCTYFAGELQKIDNNVYVFEYYSKNYSRGERIKLSCGESGLSNALLTLVMCDILGVNIFEGARRMEEYYHKT